MKLPFLKNHSWPRIGKPQDEKLVNASPDELVEQHLMGELMDAVERKDVGSFRKTMEALIMNMFDWDGDSDAKSS